MGKLVELPNGSQKNLVSNQHGHPVCHCKPAGPACSAPSPWTAGPSATSRRSSTAAETSSDASRPSQISSLTVTARDRTRTSISSFYRLAPFQIFFLMLGITPDREHRLESRILDNSLRLLPLFVLIWLQPQLNERARIRPAEIQLFYLSVSFPEWIWKWHFNYI